MENEVTATEAAKEILRDAGEDTERPKRRSQATRLVELAKDIDLWHTPDGEAFASVKVSDHNENYLIKSRSFRTWLMRQYWQAEQSAVNAQATQDAIGTLSGRAVFEGNEDQVHVRLAPYGDAVYIDLANRDWEAIEITPEGWNVVSNPPVMFRRSKGMLPLPYPAKGGSINSLKSFVNYGSEADWILMVSWLVASMFPQGPYPVLILNGEQGSAKTTTAENLRSLFDPNTVSLRTKPKDERDLMIAANNGACVGLDNLSSIPDWLSDALCRISTGGGLSTRTLYENDEETLFQVQRPVVLTGIEELATRGDLLDRALNLTLPQIDEGSRLQLKELEEQFKTEQPRILGALLDTMASVLRRLPHVQLEVLPRMADFAVLATAAEESLGLSTGSFMKAYEGFRDDAHMLAIEASPVGLSIINLASKGDWTGKSSELLKQLESEVDDRVRTGKAWPKDSTRLSNAIRRIAPNLRAMGVDVEFGKAKSRYIAIRKLTVNSVVSVAEVAPDSDAQANTGREEGDAESDANNMLATLPTGKRRKSVDANASPHGALNKELYDVCDAADAEFRTSSENSRPDEWRP